MSCSFLKERTKELLSIWGLRWQHFLFTDESRFASFSSEKEDLAFRLDPNSRQSHVSKDAFLASPSLRPIRRQRDCWSSRIWLSFCDKARCRAAVSRETFCASAPVLAYVSARCSLSTNRRSNVSIFFDKISNLSRMEPNSITMEKNDRGWIFVPTLPGSPSLTTYSGTNI